LNNGLAVVYMGKDLLHAVIDGEIALSTSSNMSMVVITQLLSCQVKAYVCDIIAWITLAPP